MPGRYEAQDAAGTRVDYQAAVVAAAVDHRDGVDEAALPGDAERREAGFARLGFLKTLDEDTLTGAIHSTPYRDSWGVRLSAGFHLD